MSDQWSAIDANDRGSLTAVSSSDGKTIVRLVGDPITGALVVTSGSSGNTFVYNEIVAGSATTFTLANTPVAGFYDIYANGQHLVPGAGNDYTITGAVITTSLSWSAGSIVASYQHT